MCSLSKCMNPIWTTEKLVTQKEGKSDLDNKPKPRSPQTIRILISEESRGPAVLLNLLSIKSAGGEISDSKFTARESLTTKTKCSLLKALQTG